MSPSKISQSLLLVDDGTVDPAMIQESIVAPLLKRNVQLHVVIAKNGASATTKIENQKFDAICVNPSVPRMSESGLQYRIESFKGGFPGPVYLLKNPEVTAPTMKAKQTFELPLNPEKFIEALIADLINGSKKPREISSFVVDVRVINAIIASTLKVLGQFGMKQIAMGKAEPRAIREPMAGVISSVLEIVSANFKGQLSISFDEKSFLEMVSGMLCEEQASINDENQDAVGEINNIIFGNAKPDLTSYGVELTIPKVVLGANKFMECPAGSASLRVPFQTAHGKFFIDLIAYP